MKTIIVLTDFSINAGYMARYALELAQHHKVNLLVCHVYQADKAGSMPGNEPRQCARAAEDSIHDLGAVVAELKSSLDRPGRANAFRPVITHCSEPGEVDNKLNELRLKHDIMLAVISSHSAHHFSGPFAKNHARAIVEKAGIPVLVVPYQVRFRPFQTIAFASAMRAGELTVLPLVIALAESSGARILLVHVVSGNPADERETEAFKQHVARLVAQIGYPDIGYRNVQDKNPAAGLRWVSRQRGIDLVVLVHRRRAGLQKIVDTSVTRKILAGADKPLLIFPGLSAKAISFF